MSMAPAAVAASAASASAPAVVPAGMLPAAHPPLSVVGGQRPLRCPHLEELRAFCTAADLGSLGRAALRLHLTKPAISRRVRSLEELVGAPLLTRSARGVALTPAGQRLYSHASRLLADAEDLTAALSVIRGSVTVRLAISHTAAELLMAPALGGMRRISAAAVEVLIANSSVVKEMALAAQADLAVAACMREEALPGLAMRQLVEDEIVIAVPLSHPWARRRQVSPAELIASPIVLRDPGAHTRAVIERTLAEHGLPALNAACEVGSTAAAKQEAHEMRLPTALSRMAILPADRLEAVQVAGLRFTRRFCIVYRQGSLTTDARHLADAFAASARSVT